MRYIKDVRNKFNEKDRSSDGGWGLYARRLTRSPRVLGPSIVNLEYVETGRNYDYVTICMSSFSYLQIIHLEGFYLFSLHLFFSFL